MGSSVGETATHFRRCYKEGVIALSVLREQLSRNRRAGWQVVGGRVLEGSPRGAAELPPELGPGAVLARLDSEETAPWSRPLLERVDLGRDFWLGDGTGEALVRVGEGGHVHPDVELHLDAPFVEISPPPDDEDLQRTTYLRVLRTGDEVYVWGRPALCYAEGAGYRDSALTVEFAPRGVIHVYDGPAWRQHAPRRGLDEEAWRALPWYRKLSVLVRNR
jgi:hypothetical protein